MQKVRYCFEAITAKVVYNFRKQNVKIFPHGTCALSAQKIVLVWKMVLPVSSSGDPSP